VQNRVVWRIKHKNPLRGLTCRCVEDKNVYINKIFCVYFTHLPRSPPGRNLHKILHDGSAPRRNQPCQILSQSGQGFWFCGGSNFWIPHKKEKSLLTHGLNYCSACDINIAANPYENAKKLFTLLPQVYKTVTFVDFLWKNIRKPFVTCLQSQWPSTNSTEEESLFVIKNCFTATKVTIPLFLLYRSVCISSTSLSHCATFPQTFSFLRQKVLLDLLLYRNRNAREQSAVPLQLREEMRRHFTDRHDVTAAGLHINLLKRSAANIKNRIGTKFDMKFLDSPPRPSKENNFAGLSRRMPTYK